MTKDEFPMTKEIRNPNSKGEAPAAGVIIQSFELRHAFDIRHSDFVIFQSLLITAVAGPALAATNI